MNGLFNLHIVSFLVPLPYIPLSASLNPTGPHTSAHSYSPNPLHPLSPPLLGLVDALVLKLLWVGVVR